VSSVARRFPIGWPTGRRALLPPYGPYTSGWYRPYASPGYSLTCLPGRHGQYAVLRFLLPEVHLYSSEFVLLASPEYGYRGDVKGSGLWQIVFPD